MEAIVEYNYGAQEPDELTLRKGDIIKDIKVMHGGWWEGTLRDRRGMFPDNFVKVIEPASGGISGGAAAASVAPTVDADVSPTLRREEVPLRNGSGRRWCKVLFSYDPCNEDELALVPHESIEFLGEVEEGWWKGRLRGVIGVFPSNFVSPPAPEEKELCKVLFPYEAANEDELTLVEGDIITILSRDAPDRGWWKGELDGQIGLFPDNFVEVLGSKSEHRRSDPDQWHETNHGTSKSSSSSSSKHSSYTRQRGGKAHARKSLDSRLVHTESSTKKTSISSSTSTISSSTVSSSASLMTNSAEKKSMISNLKRLVNDGSTGDGNDNADAGLGEELDGIERGEGVPLSHLTASRAKAPRRRLPSTQLLRHQTSTINDAPSTLSTTLSENNIANGNADSALEQLREDESDAPIGKTRRMAPWIEELKLNQMEKRKAIPVDRVDKPESKKDRGENTYPRLSTHNPGENVYPRFSSHNPGSASSAVAPSTQARNPLTKPQQEPDEISSKEKEKERSPVPDSHPYLSTHTGPVSPTIAPSTPAYVPYRLYNQLLDRVATLEEKQIMLQRTVSQLSEQIIPLLANASVNNKV